MDTTKNLSLALLDMQKRCVGLYYNPYTRTHEAVIDETEFTFTTISIGSLLGLHEVHYTKDEDHVVIMFPDGPLSQMMNNPVEFDKWWKYITNNK